MDAASLLKDLGSKHAELLSVKRKRIDEFKRESLESRKKLVEDTKGTHAKKNVFFWSFSPVSIPFLLLYITRTG